MKSIFLKVGEHVFLIQSEIEQIIQQVERDYSSFILQISSSKPDLLIWLEPGSGVTTVDFHVDITAAQGKIIYERSDYRLEVNTAFDQATLSVLNPLAFKHALMNLYSALIVHQSWGLLLHSSCLEQTGKAYLFAGRSGAGKSTVARLSSPRAVFSDEATIVKITENYVEVLPSPFNSELKTTTLHPSCFLSAIYLLVQSQDVRMKGLNRSDALFQIIDKVFYWPYKEAETRKVLQLCRQLINQVPAYELYFQKNNQFWELIS